MFSGLQLGVTFTPTTGTDLDGTSAVETDNDAADTENEWEVAARYERSYNGFDFALGAGYSQASQEVTAATDDDLETWNAGATLGFGDVDLGVAYLTTNNGVGGTAADDDTDTLVVGANYTLGAYVLGASYLNQQNENATNDEEIDRWSAGAVYEWGPGMTLRANVQYQDAENIGGVSTADADATQVAVGTMLNF